MLDTNDMAGDVRTFYFYFVLFPEQNVLGYDEFNDNNNKSKHYC